MQSQNIPMLCLPLKMLFSASMVQNELPDVGGESVRGLCWSITRIRKWTNKKKLVNKITS